MQSEYHSVKNPDNVSKVNQAFKNRSEYNEGLPIHLHIETSGACNLPCPICPRGAGLIKRSGFLEWGAFHQLFSSLSNSLCKVVFSGWGEPLLNVNTLKMIAHVVEDNIPVDMNTNGILLCQYADELVESGLTTINVSLDGAVSKAPHLYVADQTFDRAVEGIKALVEAKLKRNATHPIIHGQFILDSDTVNEIDELTHWAFNLGIGHVKFKRKHEVMPGQIPRSEQKTEDELKALNKHKLVRSNEDLGFSLKTCAHPWESMFLACTGDLSICSWDPYLKINLGRKYKDFNAIWNGTKVKTMRKWHAGKTNAIGEPCLKCNRLPGYLRFEDAVDLKQTKSCIKRIL